jgi:hypothetical protein
MAGFGFRQVVVTSRILRSLLVDLVDLEYLENLRMQLILSHLEVR